MATDTVDLEPEAGHFQSVQLLEVELTQPLPAVSAYHAHTGRRYRRAQVLVRLHDQPIGLVALRLNDQGLSSTAHAREIWQALHQQINSHLRQDGLPQAAGLDADGLPASNRPLCLQTRAQTLAQAPLITIVVCTRDRTEHLAACLSTLVALEYPRYEIIVVDNAPQTTATADLIHHHYAHLAWVRYVREDRPGLSWARNCGLQHARGEIVAYTDDDVRADRYWLAGIAIGFFAADNVACVTGLTLAAELETQAQAWFEQFGGFNKGRGFSRLIFNMAPDPRRDPLYPYLSALFGAGVNMAFRVPVLRELGGFDPALGAGTPAAGGEDIEAYFRVVTKGYTLVYEPTALLHHFHRREYVALRQQLYGYGIAFTAFLSKCLVDDPRRILYLAGKLPYALHYLLSAESPRGKHKRASYPPELTRIELRGMLYGMLAYACSRWRTRKIIGQFGPPNVQKREMWHGNG